MVEVEVADKREGMANSLLMRGHATMKEILTVSFGEWPPKGLDINPEIKHGQHVMLADMGDTEQVGGLSKPFKEREGNLWIKASVSTSQKYGTLYSTLAHELVHILQGDHSYRMKKGFFRQLAEAFKSDSPVLSQAIMDKIIEGGDNSISKQYNAAAVPRGERMLSYMRQNALRDGTEIQARLNQIIADGYPRWGRLPNTVEEFYAAMANAGFNLPEHIKAKLAALPESASAKMFLNAPGEKGKGIDKRVGDILKVLNSLEEKSQKQFWDKGVLELYSDLIEMYGDGPGRARFGLGVNPKTQMPLKYFPGQTEEGKVKKSAPSPLHN